MLCLLYKESKAAQKIASLTCFKVFRA